MKPSHHRCSSENGFATLATLLLLLMSALLAAAWAQRSALNEIRSAGNQLHEASAFEAAEAGLEWTQAMLNTSHAVGADCRPSGAADAAAFRSRHLLAADAAGHIRPRPADPGGPSSRIACVRDNGDWSCSCSAAGSATPSTRDSGHAPMFVIELAAGARPGSLQVSVVGCSHAARPCSTASQTRADASVRLRTTLALLPALLAPPPATLTAVGSIAAGAAALGLHNADALSAGIAAHAGDSVDGSALRISSTPGASTAAAVLSGDGTLASLTPGQLFGRLFGVDFAQWKYQPGVRRLPCTSDCSGQLLELLQTNADVARVAIEGNLRIERSVQIGSRDKPVVLAIDGDLLLDGPLQIHGLVIARQMRWNGVALDGGGLLHGAVVLSGGYSGDGAADLVYDPLLMRRLKRDAGTWVRLPGSWRDG